MVNGESAADILNFLLLLHAVYKNTSLNEALKRSGYSS
jgi:hypothetical protein